MTVQTLTLRALNRAILARQMLLARSSEPVETALERLVGMQAQLPSAPFVGLWTRLQDFSRADLAAKIQSRAVVKATLLRATLHLVTTADYLRLRTTLQPALSQASGAIARQRGAQVDLEELLAVARAFFLGAPHSFAEFSELLSQRYPGQDVGVLRYTARTRLPLVQFPVDSAWCYPGSPAFTLAEEWIGRPVDPQERLRELLLRYLAAFGPASTTDMQTWSGLAGLKTLFQELRPELVVYRDERGRELFDAPGRPLPAEDTPAPVRFLPEYDNLLLSHTDRGRIVAPEYKPRVYLPGLRVSATVLIDGFVRAAWKIEKQHSSVTLLVQPFAPISAGEQAALETEGEGLLRFLAPGAPAYAVQIGALPE